MRRTNNYSAYNRFDSYSEKKKGGNDSVYRISGSSATPEVPPQSLQGPTNQPPQGQGGGKQGIQQGIPPGMNPTQAQQPPRPNIPREQSAQSDGEPSLPSFLHPMDSKQVYNLLTNEQHNSRNGVPLKIILYCSAVWCSPCKLLQPKIEELTRDTRYRGITFIKIDCSDPTTLCPELRNLLNIDAVPIVFSFIGNKQINMTVGAAISEIETQCEQLASI